MGAVQHPSGPAVRCSPCADSARAYVHQVTTISAKGALTASVLLLAALDACAAAPPPTERSPATKGSCAYLSMEYDEREAERPSGSASIVLVYRPPGAGEDGPPLSAKVQVRQERVNDLRARLEHRPTLVCEPDPGLPGGYRLTLP